ncbi:Esterase FE4, partial [Orchesella cincta]
MGKVFYTQLVFQFKKKYLLCVQKDLFSAAIAQSGVATIGWAMYPDPEFEEPKKLAHAVDCPTSNTEYMVECLRKIKPEILARATDFKDSVWFERTKSPVMAPGIEYYKGGENSSIFLSENTETIFDKGTFNRVPFLIGATSHEGLALHAAPILLNPINTKKMNEQWGRVAPEALFYWNLAKDPCRVSTKLRSAYFKDQNISMESIDNLRQLYSDMGFEYPARKVGIKHARFAPVYFYNFTRPVKRSFVDLYGWKHKNMDAKPPTHGDDIQFLFNGLKIWPDVKKSSSDYEFSANFVKLWTSFAKTGKPSHIWGSQIESIQPVNATAERHNWLLIDNELGLQTETDDFLERMRVIDEICKNDFDYCSSLNMT